MFRFLEENVKLNDPTYNQDYIHRQRATFLPILISLFILDIYWMKMIVRMVKSILRLEIRGDIRDQDEAKTARKPQQVVEQTKE
ncbi:Ceramide_synthetase [Hexamita inflata]|nr:Ceramide synthetase [Hexamita inflata]